MQQLRQKRREFGLEDTTTQERLGCGQAAYFVRKHIHQFGLSIWTSVGQSALQLIPDALIGVQFGCVRRKRHQMQAGSSREEFLNRLAAMDFAVVQQNDQMAGHLTQQMAKELLYFFPVNVVFIQLAVQRAMEAFWTDGNAGDRGDAVMTVSMTHDRGLSHGTPCSADRGNQEEAQFVDKYDMGCQPRRVFFTAGQTDRFHSSIACSSRSTALRSGFWGLQCNWCRSLPT